MAKESVLDITLAGLTTTDFFLCLPPAGKHTRHLMQNYLFPLRKLGKMGQIPLVRKEDSNIFTLAESLLKIERGKKKRIHECYHQHHYQQDQTLEIKESSSWRPNIDWSDTLMQASPHSPSEDTKPFLLTVSGGAGRFPFAYGMALALRHLVRHRYPERDILYAGVSSGSIVALMLALDLSEEEIRKQNRYIWKLYSKPHVTEWTHTFLMMRRVIFKMLALREDDWKERLNDRLFVGVARWERSRFRTIVVSKYSEKKDVVDAILSSSHLFAVGRWPLRRMHVCDDGLADHKVCPQKWVADGGFSQTFVEISNEFQSVPIIYSVADKDDSSGLRSEDFLPNYTRRKWDRLVKAGLRHIRNNPELYLALVDGRRDDLVEKWSNGHTKSQMIRMLSSAARTATSAVARGIGCIYTAIFETTLPPFLRSDNEKPKSITESVFLWANHKGSNR